MQSHHHQQHLDSPNSPSPVRSTNHSNTNKNLPNSFVTMLQSSSGGSGNDGFPSQHGGHDFTTLTSVNGNDYAHLSHGGSNNSHHHHHHPSHHSGSSGSSSGHQGVNSTSNNNNNNGSGHSSSSKPPKKPPPPNGKKTKGRVKIKMEFIDNKLRRYTTFSKRKTGIMKKAYELSTLTGTQVMLLVASETGHVYTFATRKLQPMITSEAGKALIQTCLNSPDPPNTGSDTQRMSATGYEETELTYAADPNGSDHDVKDEESESGSSDEGDESINESEGGSEAPIISLPNGMLPANFAALLAASTSGLNQANLKASGLSIGLVPSSTSSSQNQGSSSSVMSNTTSQQHHQHLNSHQRPGQHYLANDQITVSISPVKSSPKNIQPRTSLPKKQQQQAHSPLVGTPAKGKHPLPSGKFSSSPKPAKIKKEVH